MDNHNTENQLDAKSQLFKLLQGIGHTGEDITDYQSQPNAKGHSCSLTVTFPNGLEINACGIGSKKKQAEIEASQDVINQLHKKYPELIVDWDKIYIDAQAGDVLIKLGVYLSGNLKVSENSLDLQRNETNKHLSKVFDQWQIDKDPDVTAWGNHINEHKKASWVEALLWRRYKEKIITSDAPERLKLLIKAINIETF